ncbi:MAG TPA: phosphatase PAP2 family protein [Vicinamibacteria bacterium]|nr:phosphatase PAP2 family protein [Vicinamibacteria bacterium]
MSRKKVDLELLAGALVVLGGLTCFLLVAQLLDRRLVRTLDERLMLSLRNPANLADALGPPWFEGAVRDISALGSIAVLMLLSLAVISFLLIRRQRHAAILVFAAAGGGALLMGGLKEAFGRPRPQLVPHLFGDVATPSFPSGHAMAAAAIYLTLAALVTRLVEDRRARAFVVGVALVLVLLIGVSRVYLGVHWPSDVLAGWTAGLSWAVACWIVMARLQRRGVVEKPSETTNELPS